MPGESGYPKTADPVLQEPTGDPTEDKKRQTIDMLRRLRYFRRQLDQRRAYFYRQYIGQRDQKFYPDNVTPRANSFVPYPLSNVETIVARVMDAFFSFDPWFECNGRTPQDEDAAGKMQMVLHQKLRQARFQGAFETLVRNIAIYGHAGMKVDWDFGADVVTYPVAILAQGPMGPILNPQTGQPIVLGQRMQTRMVPRACPKLIPIDVYDLLIDPDGKLVAHLTEKTLGEVMNEAQANPEMYLPEGLQTLVTRVSALDKDPNQVLIRIAEVWNEYDNTQTIVTFGEDSEALSWKDLRASYRAMSISPYKRKVYGGEPILLRHTENPFAHRRNPILHTSYIKLPNELYGLGAIEVISDLTESLNKFVNMITDNWNMSINRRYAYDVNSDIDQEALNSFNVPGGRVGCSGDPNKVIAPLPTFTPAAGDYTILETYKGMVEMTSGVSDFYSKGMGSPTGNRTATGINQVMQESNSRFKMFIRNLEVEILQPLLEMCSTNVQQFITDQQEVMITEAPPGIPKQIMVQPEELIGAIHFNLVAANYATNKLVRQRNLLAWFNLMMQSPFFNQYEGFREMAKVFEVRNVNRMLKTPQQVQMEQQQQMAQQIQMMILESMLQTEGKARLQQSKPVTSKDKQGRPRQHQFEGKIPGAGLTTHIRELAQSLTGAHAMGLGGLGEIGGGGE